MFSGNGTTERITPTPPGWQGEDPIEEELLNRTSPQRPRVNTSSRAVSPSALHSHTAFHAAPHAPVPLSSGEEVVIKNIQINLEINLKIKVDHHG